ncbi:terminase small subunit [Phaeobacter inhibens]|uniref:Terminase small subunit n=1 Tax=Phaeobacter inhibens TaxID=221822 RepID=A0A2I7K5P3_9RHOB|nr:Terminase small subunit [Phaeobacter inhibens]
MSGDNAKLNEKQKRFAEEYLIDLNATQAAIRAGYSERTAEQQGYQLLQKTSVMEAVREAPLYCQTLTFKLRSKRPNRSVQTEPKSPKTGCCRSWRADLKNNQKEINLPGLCGAVARPFFGNSHRNIGHRYGGNLATHFRTNGTPKSRLIPGGPEWLPAAIGAGSYPTKGIAQTWRRRGHRLPQSIRFRASVLALDPPAAS